jgi:hypothetical protein
MISTSIVEFLNNFMRLLEIEISATLILAPMMVGSWDLPETRVPPGAVNLYRKITSMELISLSCFDGLRVKHPRNQPSVE